VHRGGWYSKMEVVKVHSPPLDDPDIRSAEKSQETSDVPGLNISGNTSRTCLRISRSLFSSGVSRARTPYNVTRRWLTIAGVELCNGIHRRNSRCWDPFSYNPSINSCASIDPESFCPPLSTKALALLVQSIAARTMRTKIARF
jgi:hypothetical protein